MALSATGIGSGLDVSGLVSQLMELEKRPLTALDTKEASFKAKLSAYGQLKSAVASFQSAVDALNDAAKFSATKASVADTSILSATSSSAAAAGTYSVRVDALASAQRIATGATAEFTPVAGDLTLTFGTVSGGVFTPDGQGTQTLSFAGGTVEELRDAINDAGLGIKASVINNGTVKQLVLTGTTTGAAQAFSVGGTVGLAYDPTSTTSSSDPVYRVQEAQDARFEVDGIAITRSGNSVSDVIEGVTLNFAKAAPTTTTTVTVTEDKSGAKSAIEAFVKAYNDLGTTIKNLTNYDADTQQASTLTGDSTARTLQNQLRGMMTTPIDGLPGVTTLAEFGVSLKSDGTLAVDSTKLDAALNDPAKAVGTFFAGEDGITGFAATLSARLDGYLDSDGLLAARTEGINASMKSLDKRRDVLEARLEQIERRYMAQFTALDTLIASMQQTSSFLEQQLANLPKISSSSDN